MSKPLALSIILILIGFTVLPCAEAADPSDINPCSDSSEESSVPVPYPNITSSSWDMTGKAVQINGKEVENKDVNSSYDTATESTDEEGIDP